MNLKEFKNRIFNFLFAKISRNISDIVIRQISFQLFDITKNQKRVSDSFVLIHRDFLELNKRIEDRDTLIINTIKNYLEIYCKITETASMVDKKYNEISNITDTIKILIKKNKKKRVAK